MKNFTPLKLCFITMFFVFASCEKENTENQNQQFDNGISKEILAKLKKHHFNTDEVEKITITDIDSTQQEVYSIEGDVVMTHDEIMNLGKIEGVSQSKQYSTRYILRKDTRIVYIVGYTGNNQYGLSATAQQGLRYAVDNYNNLNLTIKFQLRFENHWGSWNSNAITVFVDNSINTSRYQSAGRAGFPSNGYPYRRVRINRTANITQSNQQLEHLMAHEIGHCIGMRHTDWDTRYTCGQNSNEGGGYYGAYHIYGTPGPSRDPYSIMNSCYPYNTDGEWSYYDKVALQQLY